VRALIQYYGGTQICCLYCRFFTTLNLPVLFSHNCLYDTPPGRRYSFHVTTKAPLRHARAIGVSISMHCQEGVCSLMSVLLYTWVESSLVHQCIFRSYSNRPLLEVFYWTSKYIFCKMEQSITIHCEISSDSSPLFSQTSPLPIAAALRTQPFNNSKSLSKVLSTTIRYIVITNCGRCTKGSQAVKICPQHIHSYDTAHIGQNILPLNIPNDN
jgi:hypothetical protein